jgi:hypothetical protein
MAKNKDVSERDIEPVNMEGIEPVSAGEAAKAPAPPAPVFTGEKRNFLVKLQHVPSWVVEATDPANAFEAYKQATGVISSEYQPEIIPSEAPLGRCAA